MNLFYRVNYYLLNADSILIYSFPDKKKTTFISFRDSKNVCL
jgi:hypothetical protein